MSTKKSKSKAKTFEVETIEKKQIVDGKVQYFIKWVGFDSAQNTWEPEEHILDKNLINEFEAKQGVKSSPKTPKKNKAPKTIQKPATMPAPATKRVKAEASPTKEAPSAPSRHIEESPSDDEIKILGAKPEKGVIQFLIEFPETKKLEFIDSTVANKKYPQQVIKFYESRLDWLSDEIDH